MPFARPDHEAANFTTDTSTGVRYVLVELDLVFSAPDGYVSPPNSSADFQYSAIFISPPGDAVNFIATTRVFEIFAGHGDVTIRVTAVGSGAVGVAGSGAVSIGVSANGTSASRKPMVRAETSSKWSRHRSTMRVLNSRTPATNTTRESARQAAWSAPAGISGACSVAWQKAATPSSERHSGWSAFNTRIAVDRPFGWMPATTIDINKAASWGEGGASTKSSITAEYNAAAPEDVLHKALWSGPLIPKFDIVPYMRPLNFQANFSIAGGGINFFLNTGVPSINSHGVYFHLGAGGYIPQTVDYPNFNVPLSPGNAADFVYNPQYELALDDTGKPVFEKSVRQNRQDNPWGSRRAMDQIRKYLWLKYSRPMNPGWGVVPPGGPVIPVPGETLTIPVKRVYIVVNEILLLRADDNTPISASTLNVSFDCDSWVPSFSATIDEASLDAIMPDPAPVALYAYINGSEFRFLVEKMVRSRQFGQRSVSISGRGIACELDTPFAVVSQHTNASAMTAQQIIDAALGFSGWQQTWGITDWLVPANAFSLSGTPAAVAAAVAEASGSVLQAHWAERTLRMLPRYAFRPWAWATATPDYVIPSAIAQTESVEWIEKPSYNVVYVSGEQVGVIGQVKIAGTAGDYAAPMVAHQLITHADAARQRGMSILCDTGKKAMMGISMPVLPEIGVIDVCRLIEFSDGVNTRRGIVRANSVSVNLPRVRQNLTIEATA